MFSILRSNPDPWKFVSPLKICEFTALYNDGQIIWDKIKDSGKLGHHSQTTSILLAPYH